MAPSVRDPPKPIPTRYPGVWRLVATEPMLTPQYGAGLGARGHPLKQGSRVIPGGGPLRIHPNRGSSYRYAPIGKRGEEGWPPSSFFAELVPHHAPLQSAPGGAQTQWGVERLVTLQPLSNHWATGLQTWRSGAYTLRVFRGVNKKDWVDVPTPLRGRRATWPKG